jgi:hypothetical protein
MTLTEMAAIPRIKDMTFSELVPDLCSENSAGFTTNPAISQDVVDEMSKMIPKDSGLKFEVVELGGRCLKVTGFRPPLNETTFRDLRSILRQASERVAEKEAKRLDTHRRIVEQYAINTGLPLRAGKAFK